VVAAFAVVASFVLTLVLQLSTEPFLLMLAALLRRWGSGWCLGGRVSV
jgi:hypothetical protein